jgi:hypothetical protein
VSVKCIALSEFIASTLEKSVQIDLLKMDIEGAEDEVIQDLMKHNLLPRISAMVIEYHHNLPGKISRFNEMIDSIVKNGFFYEIEAVMRPISSPDKFQDILIRAYRK